MGKNKNFNKKYSSAVLPPITTDTITSLKSIESITTSVKESNLLIYSQHWKLVYFVQTRKIRFVLQIWSLHLQDPIVVMEKNFEIHKKKHI